MPTVSVRSEILRRKVRRIQVSRGLAARHVWLCITIASDSNIGWDRVLFTQKVRDIRSKEGDPTVTEYRTFCSCLGITSTCSHILHSTGWRWMVARSWLT